MPLPRFIMVRSGKNGDLHLKQIAYYKRTGEYHPTTLPSERSGIRRAAKKFVFKGKINAPNLLYRIYINAFPYIVLCGILRISVVNGCCLTIAVKLIMPLSRKQNKNHMEANWSPVSMKSAFQITENDTMKKQNTWILPHLLLFSDGSYSAGALARTHVTLN